MFLARAAAQGPQASHTPRSASQAAHDRDDDGPLQLRISAPKTTIIQCEPVPVKFELKNVSDKTVSVHLSLSPIFGLLVVEVTPPRGKPYQVQPLGLINVDGVTDMEPQESVTHGRVLHHYGDEGFHFRRPGQYRIDATFDDSSLRARSNTLVLTVNKADGVDAMALQEHWGCNPVGQFMMGATSDRVIAREFRAILDKYPTSVYAPWCELALVRAQRKRARDDRSLRKQFGAEIFPTLTENAIRDYERFLKTHPEFPFPFPVYMRYQIAKMKLDLGRKEEALREIEELFEKHPEVDFLKEANFKIDLYAKRGRELTGAKLP
jgi:hypothetical protein